jgi:hypothetical protein
MTPPFTVIIPPKLETTGGAMKGCENGYSANNKSLFKAIFLVSSKILG